MACHFTVRVLLFDFHLFEKCYKQEVGVEMNTFCPKMTMPFLGPVPSSHKIVEIKKRKKEVLFYQKFESDK